MRYLFAHDDLREETTDEDGGMESAVENKHSNKVNALYPDQIWVSCVHCIILIDDGLIILCVKASRSTRHGRLYTWWYSLVSSSKNMKCSSANCSGCGWSGVCSEMVRTSVLSRSKAITLIGCLFSYDCYHCVAIIANTVLKIQIGISTKSTAA